MEATLVEQKQAQGHRFDPQNNIFQLPIFPQPMNEQTSTHFSIFDIAREISKPEYIEECRTQIGRDVQAVNEVTAQASIDTYVKTLFQAGIETSEEERKKLNSRLEHIEVVLNHTSGKILGLEVIGSKSSVSSTTPQDEEGRLSNALNSLGIERSAYLEKLDTAAVKYNISIKRLSPNIRSAELAILTASIASILREVTQIIRDPKLNTSSRTDAINALLEKTKHPDLEAIKEAIAIMQQLSEPVLKELMNKIAYQQLPQAS